MMHFGIRKEVSIRILMRGERWDSILRTTTDTIGTDLSVAEKLQDTIL